MANVCCVEGCRSGIGETSTNITFHRFPISEEQKTLWTAAVNDDLWEPSEDDQICSLHFKKDDFVQNDSGEQMKLSDEAVPSLRLLPQQEEMNVDETSITATSNIPCETNTEATENDDEEDDDDEKEEKGLDANSKYEYLRERISVDMNASRETLLEQFNKAYIERATLRKRMKMLRQKNLRVVEKISKACEKISQQEKIKELGTDSEVKKKKKQEVNSKLVPIHLDEIVRYLETQDLLSSKAINVIRSLLGRSLYENINHNHKAADIDVELTPVMKTFAKTLLFYSSEAYHMVKEVYELPIPVPSVTRTWYNMGLGLPGWSSEAFLMLKDEIQKCENTVLNTCIIVGEFDLSAASSFEENEVRGHIDYGTTGDLEVQNYSENLPLAQSALFFMLVPLNPGKKWRIPLAYFLIETLSPEERGNVILECLWRVYNMGSVAVALLVDASLNSRRTVESLGISFEDLPYPSTSFPHPADGLIDVFVIFDSYHILDLLRHTWASVVLMVDEKGGAISWKYFTELVKVQETQAGSSEQTDQIATWYWDSSLMRKRLVSQVFTNEVANAIECCSTSLMLPQFTGCDSTVVFIRTINKIVDLINPTESSNPTFSEWKKSIVEALNYLFVLRDRTGQGIFATNCKGPFVCLYMNLLSILELLPKIGRKAMAELNLNGLDLLFIEIRSKLNWEDYPPVSKFTYAYSILLHEKGVSLSENHVKLGNYWWLDCHDVANARKSGLGILRPVIKTENTPPLPNYLTFYPVLLQNELQRFRASQLVLVHTVKRVADILHCNSCIEGLQMTYIQDNPTLILLRKTCGGFVYPSQGVVEVCALASHHLNVEMRTAAYDVRHDMFSRRESALVQHVCLSVMSSIVDRNRNLFPQLNEHQKSSRFGADHVCRLIKVLTASFVLLRLQSLRAWSSQ
ncbi:DNA transposase [Frankliniella fusca]|uniref:DNA transposase n=1 Tax=Frankliniella fusca TaxID=407009 RepID=A0AAE1HU30_9NEOP|nr:DNA transposase [Frankliniella fusca]